MLLSGVLAGTESVSSKFTTPTDLAYCGLSAVIGFTWTVISICESEKAPGASACRAEPIAVTSKS